MPKTVNLNKRVLEGGVKIILNIGLACHFKIVSLRCHREILGMKLGHGLQEEGDDLMKDEHQGQYCMFRHLWLEIAP